MHLIIHQKQRSWQHIHSREPATVNDLDTAVQV